MGKGVTAYGNKVAFKKMAEYFEWMASSDPSDHYELHSLMYLEDDASKFEGKEIKNVYALFDKKTKGAFFKKTKNLCGFELTFMMVPENELDEMDACQKTGLIPAHWNTERSEYAEFTDCKIQKKKRRKH